MRTPILVATLAFIGLLAALTISVVVRRGVDVITAFALLVLALFAFGVVGALLHPPPEE